MDRLSAGADERVLCGSFCVNRSIAANEQPFDRRASFNVRSKMNRVGGRSFRAASLVRPHRRIDF